MDGSNRPRILMQVRAKYQHRQHTPGPSELPNVTVHLCKPPDIACGIVFSGYPLAAVMGAQVARIIWRNFKINSRKSKPSQPLVGMFPLILTVLIGVLS